MIRWCQITHCYHGTALTAASLDALRQKRQRTVYRLTLVKGHNMTELEDYAALVARGQPDFIEVKVSGR